MIVELLDKALEKALSMEEEEVRRIWKEERVFWAKGKDVSVPVLLTMYTKFVREGSSPEDSFKHGLSLLSEEERYSLGEIFTDAELEQECPILQLTLLGYIDSIVSTIKRHKDLKFPTEYKEYVRRVREIATGYYKAQKYLIKSELHIPTHPADYARSIANIDIPISAINKILKLYGFEGVRKKSKHGEHISTDMIFGISDDHERSLALADYYLSYPDNSI